MMLWLLLAFAGSADWRFTDVTAEAGIRFEHSYTASRETAFIAGGVACGDYNNDGFADLYLVSGAQGSNALYRNNGDGTFTDVAQQAGVALEGRFGCGPLFADYDGDGWLDLFVGGIDSSRPILFRNTGDGRFVNVTHAAGLEFGGSTFSAAFGDLDRDGDLDMFTTHWGATGEKGYWRNNGDGTFTNATDEVGLADAFKPNHTFTPNFADLNGDRWPDLLVAADFGRSKVFLNDGTGKLIDSTNQVISDENGMGASVGDFDNDGDLDWFVTSISEASSKRGRSGNRLYANRGDGFFEDVTDQTGVRDGLWGWASGMADFDNDGWLDIFHVNGFRGTFGRGYHEDVSRFFHGNGDGTFAEKAAALGLDGAGQGRGVACFDYDGDGDLDILVANNGEAPKLYRNESGNENNYLSIRLRGRLPNSEAAGARVRVTTASGQQMREIRIGNNFVSQDPAMAHFGLGKETNALVEVTWPDGRVTRHQEQAGSLVLQQPGLSANAPAARSVWIPHVTRDGGGFETLLNLKNFSGDSGVIDLQSWDAEGIHLGQVSVELAAGEARRLGAVELFGGSNVSHLSVLGPDSCTVSATYRQTGVAASEAQIHQRAELEQVYYLYPGNPQITFDGLALVNTGSEPASISLTLLNENGQEHDNHSLTKPLAAHGKQLILLDQIFSQTEGQMIRINTTQPAAALFLRGTRPGVEPGLLFGVEPVPHPGQTAAVKRGEKTETSDQNP